MKTEIKPSTQSRLDPQMTHLLWQFVEEELSKTGDANIIINDADGEFANLTFHLDHVIENEVSEDHEGVLAYLGRLVSQSTNITHHHTSPSQHITLSAHHSTHHPLNTSLYTSPSQHITLSTHHPLNTSPSQHTTLSTHHSTHHPLNTPPSQHITLHNTLSTHHPLNTPPSQHITLHITLSTHHSTHHPLNTSSSKHITLSTHHPLNTSLYTSPSQHIIL